MATAALRAACKRLGGCALVRPALAAAASAAQQTPPSRFLLPKNLKRYCCSKMPAVVTQNQNNLKKVHLEVSGRLLPEIGFTNMSVYKISFCSDNPQAAGNIVRSFMVALQSDKLEDLDKFLSHEVSIVAVKKLVGEAVMEVKLQSLEHAVEVRFEIDALQKLVVAEGVSTREEVRYGFKKMTDHELVKVIFGGCVVNFICMVVVSICSTGTYTWGSEEALDKVDSMSP